jgi:hypothetical protein
LEVRICILFFSICILFFSTNVLQVTAEALSLFHLRDTGCLALESQDKQWERTFQYSYSKED